MGLFINFQHLNKNATIYVPLKLFRNLAVNNQTFLSPLFEDKTFSMIDLLIFELIFAGKTCAGPLGESYIDSEIIMIHI